MNSYYMASALSVLTAFFTAASAWVPDRKKSFILMVIQCLVYSAASWFYGVYATIPMMLLSALRNYLIAEERFTLKICIPFCAAAAVLGLAFNNAGIIGIVPVLATVQMSLTCCLFRGLLSSKMSITGNLILWLIYDILIRDVASFIMDCISTMTGLAAIVRIRRDPELCGK